MKTFTTKKMLTIAALAAATTASAQFNKSESFAENFMPLHRGGITMADVNGDGRQDLIYGGQYRPDDDVVYETDADGNRVKDDNGNDIVKSHGKWAVQGDPENDNSWYSLGWACTCNLFLGQGEGAYERRVTSSWHEWGEGTRIGMGALGLIPTTWGFYYFFDLNNDGRLDAYVNGRNEWGWAYAGNIGPKSSKDGEQWYVALQKQKEDGTFELLPNNLPAGKNEWYSFAGGHNSNVSFGDYDHDGYTDILVQTYHKWVEDEEDRGERLVALYRNNGDDTFTEVRVFNPLPYDVNPQRSGVFYVDEEDLEADDPYKPTYKARPTSHGASVFGDLNGDGWLDIVIIGYTDDGLTFTIYKNNQDGTFDEVDLEGKGFVRLYEGDVRVADVNNDGWLDIIAFGTQDGEGMPKCADIYLNDGDGQFNFTRSSVEEGNGLAGASDSKIYVVDLNHDGLVDIVSYGWTDVNNMQWGTRVHYQNADNTFTLRQNLGNPWGDAGDFGLGDLNGDGALDIMGDYWFGFDVYLGDETDDIEAPEAPTDVRGTYEDGKMTISWAGNDTEPGYAYNLYAKNKTTGKIAMLIPADTETGALATTENINVALRSAEPEAMSYTLTLPAGEYEIGVQTIKPDWTVSAFAKAEVSAEAGIQGTVALPTTQTRVYDANGLYVGNSTDALRRGMYIVKKGTQVTKVIR